MVLCEKFCGGFFARKDMKSMSFPMSFVVWKDFAKECRLQ
jgi:hypothetical protein